MALYSGGLIIGRIFVSEIWRAYFRESLIFFWGGGVGAYYRNFTVYYCNESILSSDVTVARMEIDGNFKKLVNTFKFLPVS